MDQKLETHQKRQWTKREWWLYSYIRKVFNWFIYFRFQRAPGQWSVTALYFCRWLFRLIKASRRQ
jgi:hypothetical protein